MYGRFVVSESFVWFMIGCGEVVRNFGLGFVSGTTLGRDVRKDSYFGSVWRVFVTR